MDSVGAGSSETSLKTVAATGTGCEYLLPVESPEGLRNREISEDLFLPVTAIFFVYCGGCSGCCAGNTGP
jgi:hypothetical protein